GDEFTQAIVTLNLAREAGVERVVYLSVFGADRAVEVPHFAVKFGAERMLRQMGFGATILRRTYFIDNEAMIRPVMVDHPVYPMPLGGNGLSMVDPRDIAELPAVRLTRTARCPCRLPAQPLILLLLDLAPVAAPPSTLF
ncbi:NmrA family NAD(P)-binding protein, partial [Methylobacterium sp. E-016]|uniref:SDR family oxidoreductase n=1 Tax=Methylobacterium sp. E-016 TaxID=2836556 RepID=UPI001FBBC48A